jgi:hypothetical protein
MITVTQAERLVRKIAEAMTTPVTEAHIAKLAQEYADACRVAARRLEQCALMIEAGQSLQALQLAETPPPLLDLITVLSFRQAADWRAYCQAHQLPFTEPFYDKHLRQLNSSYGKGVAADHPYYRDYRRAVLKKNDERALSILRVIARVNPGDENTTDELRRVEDKLLKGKLEKLAEVMAAGDSAGTHVQMARIETSGVRVPPTHPIWQQAQAVRCQNLLKQAGEARNKDAWQQTESLVEQIHSIATQYDLQLPAADADAWSALEEWSSEKRRAYADEQDFQRALAAVEYEVQTIEARRAKSSRPGLLEARRQFDSLSNKWRDLERCGRPKDEDLSLRFDQAQAWLQREMKSAQLRRKLAIGAVVIVVLAGIAAMIPSVRDALATRAYEHEIAGMESARRVSELEAVFPQVPERLESKLQTVLADAHDFIAREKDLKRSFDESMAGLQQLAATHFRDLPQVAPRRAQAGQLLDKLAPEFQADGRSALQEWDNQWQAIRNAAINAQLARAEELAGGLNGTNGPGAADAARQIETLLSALAPWRTEPPPLDQNLEGKFKKLSDQATTWASHWDHWEKAQAALGNAQTLEEYLDRLDQMVQSPFAGNAQRDAAAEIDRLKINSETLLGQLLLPNDHASWDSLTNAASWRTALMPAQPTGPEKDAYFKLRDDKNLQNIYLYKLVANARQNNPAHTHLVFVQGTITMDRGGQMAGLVYDPEIYRDTVRFGHETYSDWDYDTILKTNRTAECESFERIGLGDLIDPNTGNYQKSILQLLDQLSRDDNSTAIFRAFVSMRLFDIARLRAADWGMNWCPSAARHYQALKDLGALDLKSGDWMAPAPLAKYEAAFARYFDRARKTSLEKEAALLERLTQQACQTDFSFAGYVDAEGRPVVRHSTAAWQEYWGWGANPESALLLFRKPGAGPFQKLAEPLPFTPLFTFNGDRRALLNDTTQAVSYPVAQTAEILPPFFAGIHE